MIRFLIRLAVSFVAALIGLIVADLVFEGFQVKVGISYLIVAGIYAVLDAMLAPLFRNMTERRARAFAGGVGLISTFVALLLTSLISGYLTIDNLGTLLGATVVVWLFTAIAAFLLPVLVVRRIVKDEDRR